MTALVGLVACVFITEADVDDKLARETAPNVDWDQDGWVRADDCDDDDPTRHPGADELPNTIDDDCDGVADEGTLVADDDGDGFCEQAPCTPNDGVTPQGGDCDDTRPWVHPGAPEICDTLKNDCDADWDEYSDHDGDGFRVADGDPDDRDNTQQAWGWLPIMAEVTCDIVRTEPGTYTRGCEGAGCPAEATPAHEVTLTHELLVMRTEVTREQWGVWKSDKDWAFADCGPRCPATRVSWEEALDFANQLNDWLELPRCPADTPDPVACEGWRLPTEAEWEYVARAGYSEPYAGASTPNTVGWVLDNAGGTVHPVGTRQPNGWGLADMTGNVWEWTFDLFQFYPSAAQTDPYAGEAIDPADTIDRVMRGAGGHTPAAEAKLYERIEIPFDDAGFDDFTHTVNTNPDNPFNWVGFRLVRTAH